VPGKHAPESPTSFYLSVGRATGGALVVLAIVAVIAIAATGTSKKPSASTSTPPATPTTHAPTVSPSSTPSTNTSPTPTATVAAKITVNVYNGTTRNGLARTLADKLTKEGYVIKTVATFPSHQTTTTIYYRPGARGQAQALLAAHPELGTFKPATSAIPTNAVLTVVLGEDYRPA